MTISHGVATRTAAADAILGRLNTGSGTPTLVFQIAAGTAVATLNMSVPAFNPASAGAATANTITSDTNAAGNASPTTKFELRDRNGLAIILGSVGTSGADINLSSTIIGPGDTVSVSSMTYTAMP